MSKILLSIPVLSYDGTKGVGPVLPDGKHEGFIAGVALTDDSVNNPFADPDQEQPEKERAYDDTYPAIAVKVTNKAGGITERFYFMGFKTWAELTQAEKDSKKFKEDPVSGYALQVMKTKFNVETLEFEGGSEDVVMIDDGAGGKRRALARVPDKEKSATAQRIFRDFLYACRVPAMENASLEQIVDELKKVVCPIGFTVVSKEYAGKRRARLTAPTLVGTSVSTEEHTDVQAATAAAQPAPEVKTADEF